jgi:hypothetical protein
VDQGGQTSAAAVKKVVQDVRNRYVADDPMGAGKQTWVTEVGWRTIKGVTPEIQAKNLQTAFTTLRGTTYVARSFWFKLKDLPNDEQAYGLIDASGANKPAYAAYGTSAR